MAKPRSAKNKTSPMSLALTIFFILLLAGTILFLFNEMKKQETLTTSPKSAETESTIVDSEKASTVSSSQTELPLDIEEKVEKVVAAPISTSKDSQTVSETTETVDEVVAKDTIEDTQTAAKTVVDIQTPTVEKVESTTVDLQTALIACQAFLEYGPLSSGKKNALTCYQSLLKKYPGETEVLQGLKQIETYYVELIKKAVDEGEIDMAKKGLANLQKVNSKSPELKELQFAVQELQQKYADTANQLYEGVLTYEAGNSAGYQMYEGEVINAKANGKGVMTFIDGKRLIGTWKEDVSVEVKPYIQNDPECFYFHKHGHLCCKKGDMEICE